MNLEYTSPDGKRWRVADAMALLARFGIVEADLPEWHLVMQQRATFWEVVCRSYGVRLFTEMDAARHVAWEDKLIAEQMGMALPAVEDLRKRAASWWKREKRKREKQEDPAQARLPDAELPPAHAPEPAPVPAPVPPDADAILKECGFSDERDEEVRSYLLRRIEDLGELLGSPSDRPAVLQMLNDEVTLFFIINRRITTIRRRIADVTREGQEPTSLDEDKLEKFLKQGAQIQKNLEAARTALGIGEGETGGVSLKIALQKNISQFIAAHRKWYAQGDTTLIDGVFTAGEVKVLTRPYGDRPLQYRVDLPILVQQFREHLWRDDFEPVTLTRDMMRRLRAGFRRGIDAVMEEEGLMIEDLDDGEEAPGRTAPVAPVAPMPAAAPAPAPAPAPPAAPEGIYV